VRIYNRALSPEEVRYHYNHGGPVAAWDMDEGSGAKINDQSGNHNDGTISGATWTSGKYGSALQFDGVDDYVDCGNDNSLNATDAITIGAWVKRGAFQIDHARILDKEGTTAYAILFYTTDSEIKLYAKIGSSYSVVSTGIILQPDTWEHIAITYNSSDGTLKGYQNGKITKIDNTSFSGKIGTNSNNLRIGRSNSGSYYFNGQIDDVKIYNYARSVEQIKMDYQQGLAAHMK